jgi:hypothetical protein
LALFFGVISLRSQAKSRFGHKDRASGRRRLMLALNVWLLASGRFAATEAQSMPGQPDDRLSIAVIKNGWHTELTLPLDAISGPLAALDPSFAGARYLLVGFGARDYFLDPNAGLDKAMAALIPGPSVLQLSGYRNPPEQSFDSEHDIVRLSLSPQGLQRIAGFVWNTLEKGDDGKPVLVRYEPGKANIFYAASHSYSALYTCNSWTAQALLEGGLSVAPLGMLFADQVMSQASRIAQQQARGDAGLPAR